MTSSSLLKAELPGDGYHRDLISCQRACPVHTDARGYVRAIAAGRFADAYLIARGPNPFASICGRVCGAPCEAACRRGKIPRVDDYGNYFGDDRPISIRALKRFACEQSDMGHVSDDHNAGKLLHALQSAENGECADTDEIAALLKAATAGKFKAAAGHGPDHIRRLDRFIAPRGRTIPYHDSRG